MTWTPNLFLVNYIHNNKNERALITAGDMTDAKVQVSEYLSSKNRTFKITDCTPITAYFPDINDGESVTAERASKTASI
jgi:hypothetical protein